MNIDKHAKILIVGTVSLLGGLLCRTAADIFALFRGGSVEKTSVP